jgi:hypothetical protein
MSKTMWPVIRTISQFCNATGWPEEEFNGMPYNKAIEVLSWYDLALDFKFKTRKLGSRLGCGCRYCDRVWG